MQSRDVCRHGKHAADFRTGPSGEGIIVSSFEPWLITLGGLLLAGSLTAAAWAWRQRRAQRHQHSIRGLLDLADEMERLLYRLRRRMQRVQDVVERVPADIGAAAHASLERDELIDSALKDLLEHRLWIQRCGGTASADELDRAHRALSDAKTRIGHELSRLERAGHALEQAADAASAEAVDAGSARPH